MKIRDFTIFIEGTKLIVNSSVVRLEKAKIQGVVQYDTLEKSVRPSITINIHAKVKDQNSISELKGLINRSDI